MSARMATGRMAHVEVHCLHRHDVLINKDGTTTHVRDRRQLRGYSSVRLETSAGDYTLPRSYLVRVRLEHECPCDGSGIFRYAGHFENGVWKGKTGVCFACRGKGYQDRADVIRNAVYWDKYARVSA